MRIGGLQKLTLLDYPGKVACTVFLSGCNLRCPYCHNPGLVLPEQSEGSEIPEAEVLPFLERRKGKLDGVCITGGEPLVRRGIVELCRMVKEIPGVKELCLTTNGSLLGPLALPHILVTRHMLWAMPEEFAGFSSVAALATGVLGETGLESSELIAAAAEKLRPRCIIVLDALAAATREKLCAVLQLTDTGLTPGSGVGNHRKEVSRRTLGMPVLALGLPTVIRAEQLVGEETPAEGEPLFVTPRDIDQRVRELSRMMAYGIDLALQPHLTVEDITGLLG